MKREGDEEIWNPKRLDYDPNSTEGQRQQAFRNTVDFFYLANYGEGAFARVRTEERCIRLGLHALRSGWSADRVADGLRRFAAARTAREAGSV